MYIIPLLIYYQDTVPTLNAFAQQYCTGKIFSSGCTVCSQTVEDAVRQVGQALAALDAREPLLTSQSKVDICLRFQYRCYYKYEPPPHQQSKTTPAPSSPAICIHHSDLART